MSLGHGQPAACQGRADDSDCRGSDQAVERDRPVHPRAQLRLERAQHTQREKRCQREADEGRERRGKQDGQGGLDRSLRGEFLASPADCHERRSLVVGPAEHAPDDLENDDRGGDDRDGCDQPKRCHLEPNCSSGIGTDDPGWHRVCVGAAGHAVYSVHHRGGIGTWLELGSDDCLNDAHGRVRTQEGLREDHRQRRIIEIGGCLGDAHERGSEQRFRRRITVDEGIGRQLLLIE